MADEVSSLLCCLSNSSIYASREVTTIALATYPSARNVLGKVKLTFTFPLLSRTWWTPSSGGWTTGQLTLTFPGWHATTWVFWVSQLLTFFKIITNSHLSYFHSHWTNILTRPTPFTLHLQSPHTTHHSSPSLFGFLGLTQVLQWDDILVAVKSKKRKRVCSGSLDENYIVVI